MELVAFLAIIILGFVLLFFAGVWPVKKVAKWFHAGRQGYTWATMAFAASFCLSIVLQMICSFLQLGFLFLIILQLAAATFLSAWLYSKILDVHYTRGFGIMLLSGVMTTGIMLVIGLVAMIIALSAGFKADKLRDTIVSSMIDPDSDEDATRKLINSLSRASQSLCQCQDLTCRAKLIRIMGVDVNKLHSGMNDADKATLNYTLNRHGACMPRILFAHFSAKSSGIPIPPISLVEIGNIVHDEELTKAVNEEDIKGGGPAHSSKIRMTTLALGETPTENPLHPEIKFTFQEVSLAQLTKYQGHPVKIIMLSGAQEEGELYKIVDNKVQLKVTNEKGFYVLSFPIKELKSTWVYRQMNKKAG